MAQSDQLRRLEKRLQAIPKAAKEAVLPSLVRSAERLTDRMRQLAPEDSGDLKTSITYTLPGQTTPPFSQPGGAAIVPELTVRVTVGDDDVRYPHLVEYGTSTAKAQPFFWVSVRLLATSIKRGTKRSIAKAIKDEWARK